MSYKICVVCVGYNNNNNKFLSKHKLNAIDARLI